MGSHEYVLTTKNLMIALRRIITHFISSMTFWMRLPVMNYIVLGMAIMVITRSKLQRKTSWKEHSPLHGVHLPIWWCLLGCVLPMELFKGSWTRCWNHTLDFLFKCPWMTFECMGVGDAYSQFEMIVLLIGDGECLFESWKMSFRMHGRNPTWPHCFTRWDSHRLHQDWKGELFSISQVKETIASIFGASGLLRKVHQGVCNLGISPH